MIPMVSVFSFIKVGDEVFLELESELESELGLELGLEPGLELACKNIGKGKGK